MPFAAENQISQDPIGGGIEITEAEYQLGLEAIVSGRLVSIAGGRFRTLDPEPEPAYVVPEVPESIPGPVPPAPPEPEPEPEPEPTPEEARRALELAVNAEAERRTRRGFVFPDKFYDYDDTSQKRITGAATLAGFAMMAGAQPGDLRWNGGDEDFVWIAQDNSLTPMDAQTVFAFGKAAAAWEQAHVFAGRALKDLAEIPADFADDSYWPPIIPDPVDQL